jgi:hypothetical protein
MYRLIAVLAVALLVVPAYAERTITLAPGQAVPLDWDTPDGSRSVTVYSNTTYSTGYFTSNPGTRSVIKRPSSTQAARPGWVGSRSAGAT